jgi:hypothetical protein
MTVMILTVFGKQLRPTPARIATFTFLKAALLILGVLIIVFGGGFFYYIFLKSDVALALVALGVLTFVLGSSIRVYPQSPSSAPPQLEEGKGRCTRCGGAFFDSELEPLPESDERIMRLNARLMGWLFIKAAFVQGSFCQSCLGKVREGKWYGAFVVGIILIICYMLFKAAIKGLT